MTETRVRVRSTLGVTDHNLLDNRFIDNQHTMNAISGLEEALDAKQDELTAGENIEISEEGIISATDTTYTAGENIEINEENVISASVPEYTAGANVSIDNGVISAVDTTYTAGTNVSIDNGVISAVDTTYTAGANVSIDNGVISAVDTTYTAGTNISIDNGVISAVDTTYTAGSGISIDNGVISNTRTANDGVLTIQKNGTTVDTFTANSSTDKTINLVIPTIASDVSALPDTTKYASSISVSINSSDYKVTTTLMDQNGDTLGSAQVIDLPLESVVVSGSYDSVNKNVVLTLQNGSTITFSVADLVSGLQSEITSNNKLDADLVDDTASVNKFVTVSDKTTWNGKQDVISDLATIRTGASLGSTSVQSVTSGFGNGTISVDGVDVAITGLGSAAFTSSGSYATAAQGALADTAIQNSDLQTALATKQDVLTAGSNITISSGTISAIDTTYTAGTGIDITNNAISVDGETTTLVDTEVVSTVTLATVATTGNFSDLSGTSGLQTTSNLVTSISSSSTDTEYPSAKCVYDIIGDVETLLSAI